MLGFHSLKGPRKWLNLTLEGFRISAGEMHGVRKPRVNLAVAAEASTERGFQLVYLYFLYLVLILNKDKTHPWWEAYE